MKYFTIKSKSNGRVRFSIGKHNGFVAMRKVKWRWGFSNGAAFRQVHLGKYSFAVEKAKPVKQLWNWAV